jgi:hypothetical protein
MHHSDAEYASSAEDNVEDLTGCALGAAESYVTASSDPGRSCNDCGEKFSSTFAALLCWGEEVNFIRLEADFGFFQRPPDGFGDEHQAWFDEAAGRWFKATYHNRFGLAWGRKGTASVREYLTRLILQNTYFGDDIQLVALVNSDGKLRILTSQRHIAGEPATYDEIQDWFHFLGFCRLETAGCIAWYLPADNLLIADAHEGNVIRTARPNFLIPIDLNLIQPNGNLLDAVIAEMGRGEPIN